MPMRRTPGVSHPRPLPGPSTLSCIGGWPAAESGGAPMRTATILANTLVSWRGCAIGTAARGPDRRRAQPGGARRSGGRQPAGRRRDRGRSPPAERRRGARARHGGRALGRGAVRGPAASASEPVLEGRRPMAAPCWPRASASGSCTRRPRTRSPSRVGRAPTRSCAMAGPLPAAGRRPGRARARRVRPGARTCGGDAAERRSAAGDRAVGLDGGRAGCDAPRAARTGRSCTAPMARLAARAAGSVAATTWLAGGSASRPWRPAARGRRALRARQPRRAARGGRLQPEGVRGGGRGRGRSRARRGRSPRAHFEVGAPRRARRGGRRDDGAGCDAMAARVLAA